MRLIPFCSVVILIPVLACGGVDLDEVENVNVAQSAQCYDPNNLVWNSDLNRWEVYNTVTLCPNTVYTETFEANSNSTLDCKGSTVRGLRVYGDNAVVKNCVLEATAGVSVGAYSNITLSNIRVPSAKGLGIMFKASNSRIENCTITNSGSYGIEVRGGHDNTIYNNIISGCGGDLGPGIAIDGAYNNVIDRNTITDNGRSGILIYRNCGEPGHDQRPNESYSNKITNNYIAGHRKGNQAQSLDQNPTPSTRISGFLDIGVGIGIAYRQGLTLVMTQDWKCKRWDGPGSNCESEQLTQGYPYVVPGSDATGLCNNKDLVYARYNWSASTRGALRTDNGRMRSDAQWVTYLPGPFDHVQSDRPRDIGKTLNSQSDGKFRTNDIDDGSVNPNFDYAPNTSVEGNTIVGNDIGVLVGDQETRVVSNTFYKDSISNYFTDIFVGNKNLDYAALPNRYVRAMWGNIFDESKSTRFRCRVSTTLAKSSGRINGSDAYRCTATFPQRL